MSTQTKYPIHWNLDSFFPSFMGENYSSFVRNLDVQKITLQEHLKTNPSLKPTTVDAWAKFICDFEDFQARAGHMGTYVHMLSSVDTTDESVIKEIARIADWSSGLTQMQLTLERALGDADEASIEALLNHNQVLDLSFYLTLMRKHAKQRMQAELENLQVELGVNGELAWAQLYSQITGKLKFTLATPGHKAEVHSFSKKFSLLGNPDPAIRLAALQGSNTAIKVHEDVFAAALNALAGTRHTLWKRRGQSGFLEGVMQGSQISEATVEAMYSAIREELPRLRKHLLTKARVLGKSKLGFQDLLAPIPSTSLDKPSTKLGWDQGVELVLGAFDSYPRLQKFCDRAITGAWIDAAPGNNRAPGGYCIGSEVTREARIFMTYDGTFGDVQTLAHELGHAFHSEVLKDKRPLLGNYPMTLAETASTFAQTLLVKDVLASPASDTELKAQILTEMTNDITLFCLDIMMRYEFEKRFYAQRLEGTLSAKDLCELMTSVQREVFGEALNEDELDPYFWASKMHFFFGGMSFYNFPYTFGYLLSRFLVKQRRVRGTIYDKTYETFLLESGSATCEDICKRVLGEDITDKFFWTRALEDCIVDLDLFATVMADRR